MEICTCLVSIGGDPRHVVPKHSTTPAEIVLLQRLHGNDAVTEIVVTEKENRSHEDERDRLGARYGDDKIMETFGQYGDLPTTLKEARVDNSLMSATASKGDAPKTKKGEDE